ncbi:unnamed protein product [Diatraea saccharalis]|uniref:L27 domain-containing protein n=1 Tax=Diatraea saccharalis TaxID=40085 RepID=A0A9N9QXY7_9NEOP|nr:unnamed protein product [Diatraea saccharalis]
MPVRKQEAHRALELLEDYHCKLVKPQDRQLRLAIERVIRIFKSRLFQALLGMKLIAEDKNGAMPIGTMEITPPITVSFLKYGNINRVNEVRLQLSPTLT